MLHVLLLATSLAPPLSPAPKNKPLYGCFAHTDCDRKPYVCFAGLESAPCGPSHAEYVFVHVDVPNSVKIYGRSASAKAATQVRAIADPGAQPTAVTRVINAAERAGLSTSRVLLSSPPAH